MEKKLKWVILLFFFIHQVYAAQLPDVVIQWLEEYTQHQHEERTQDVYQLWVERAQNPINLNQVDRETLEQFPFLSDRQIENILE